MKARRTFSSASSNRPRSQWPMYTLVSMTAHTGSRDLDAVRFEACPPPRHEAPELFHLDDARDREPHGLGIRVDSQYPAGAPDCPLVDEERAAGVSRGGLPGDVSHR